VIAFAAGAVLLVSVAVGYTALFGRAKLDRPLVELPGIVAGEQAGEYRVVTPTEEAAVSDAAETAPAPAPAANIKFPLDLNAATASELEALPGIGPVLAERILAYRSEIGKFTSVEQLREVRGIGAKKLDAVKDLLVVSK
jgi:competence protein ComEA